MFETDSIITKIKSCIPEWADHPIEVSEINSGMTNRNYKFTVQRKEYFVRVCVPEVEIHGINRFTEYQCMQLAAKAGIAPQIFAYLPNVDDKVVIINSFIVHNTLHPLDLLYPRLLSQVVDVLKYYHNNIKNITHHYDVFQILNGYLAFAEQHCISLPSSICSIYNHINNIQMKLCKFDSSFATCHNDLRASNFLLSDQYLLLTDWEYAGIGDLFFDLGNLSSSNSFGSKEDELLLTAYFGTTTQEIRAKFQFMKAISVVRDGMWSMVHSALSTTGFNYINYGLAKLKRFEEMCANFNTNFYK